MSLEELAKTPYFVNEAVPNALLAEYHMKIYKVPPDTLSVVRHGPLLGKVTQSETTLNVDFSTSAMTLPLDSQDEDYQSWMQLMGESFAHGDRPNVIQFHRSFSESAGVRIRNLEQLQGLLREMIYSNARLKVSLFFSNTGREIALMRPVFALLIDHDDFKKPFVLTTVAANSKKSASGNVVAAPVLPESSPTPSFSVEPEKSTTIGSVGLYPLGQDAEKISKIYTSGLLRCRVVAFTNSGSRVKSDTSVFGSRVSPDDLTQVENLH